MDITRVIYNFILRLIIIPLYEKKFPGRPRLLNLPEYFTKKQIKNIFKTCRIKGYYAIQFKHSDKLIDDISDNPESEYYNLMSARLMIKELHKERSYIIVLPPLKFEGFKSDRIAVAVILTDKLLADYGEGDTYRLNLAKALIMANKLVYLISNDEFTSMEDAYCKANQYMNSTFERIAAEGKSDFYKTT